MRCCSLLLPAQCEPNGVAAKTHFPGAAARKISRFLENNSNFAIFLSFLGQIILLVRK
jgi:hypothetical protein